MAPRLALREVKKINGFVKCTNVTFQKNKTKQKNPNKKRVIRNPDGERELSSVEESFYALFTHTLLFSFNLLEMCL